MNNRPQSVMLTFGDPVHGFLLVGPAGPRTVGMRPPTVPTPEPFSTVTAAALVAQLDDDTRGSLLAALTAAESAKNQHAIAGAIRAQVAAEFVRPDDVVAVSLGSWEWDNGYVIERIGTVHYRDGSRVCDFEASDELLDMLADECGGIGKEFVVAVDLRTGKLTADTYGHTVYERLGLPVPADA